MSRGVLIHAHNNQQIDYALIALCNALMIRHYLDVPVCLVISEGCLDWIRQCHGRRVNQAFDKIILHSESGHNTRRFCDTLSTMHNLPWHNATRADSYQLSPFDETLLIDADYLILDKTLRHVWDSPHDLMLNRRVVPLNHSKPTRDLWVGEVGIELCWATCVYFRKTPMAEMFFDIVRHIREHYDYYSMAYEFPTLSYRNDFAFSIATHMLSGFTHSDIATLPADFLFTSFDCDELIDAPAQGDLTFLVNDTHDRWRFTVTRTKGISVHVMNKFSITRQANKLIELYA